MTLKDKLPDRLKCSPLLTMESDSDIETIAESIVNLSDSDGDFFKKTEKLLLMAALGYLRDWCEPSQRTIGNLISLLVPPCQRTTRPIPPSTTFSMK